MKPSYKPSSSFRVSILLSLFLTALAFNARAITEDTAEWYAERMIEEQKAEKLGLITTNSVVDRVKQLSNILKLDLSDFSNPSTQLRNPNFGERLIDGLYTQLDSQDSVEFFGKWIPFQTPTERGVFYVLGINKKGEILGLKRKESYLPTAYGYNYIPLSELKEENIFVIPGVSVTVFRDSRITYSRDYAGFTRSSLHSNNSFYVNMLSRLIKPLPTYMQKGKSCSQPF